MFRVQVVSIWGGFGGLAFSASGWWGFGAGAWLSRRTLNPEQ